MDLAIEEGLLVGMVQSAAPAVARAAARAAPCRRARGFGAVWLALGWRQNYSYDKVGSKKQAARTLGRRVEQCNKCVLRKMQPLVRYV